MASDELDTQWDGKEEDTLENRYLTFAVNDQEYGIEIRYVTEIVGIQKITEVPNMPKFVKGVINLRGRIIPVIYIRSRFGIDELAFDDRTCVIVTKIDELSVGLIVDTVNEVMDIAAEYVSPPPSIGMEDVHRYLSGIARTGDEVKILLDVKKLLFDSELNELANA